MLVVMSITTVLCAIVAGLFAVFITLSRSSLAASREIGEIERLTEYFQTVAFASDSLDTDPKDKPGSVIFHLRDGDRVELATKSGILSCERTRGAQVVSRDRFGILRQRLLKPIAFELGGRRFAAIPIAKGGRETCRIEAELDRNHRLGLEKEPEHAR